MKTEFLITKAPFVRSFIRYLDQDTPEVGIQKAFLRAAKRSQTKLVVNKVSKKTQEIFKNKPVVIVANHPNEMEPLALMAALPPRKDTYMIISACFMD